MADKAKMCCWRTALKAGGRPSLDDGVGGETVRYGVHAAGCVAPEAERRIGCYVYVKISNIFGRLASGKRANFAAKCQKRHDGII